MIFRTNALRPEELINYFNQLCDYLYETYPLKKFGLIIDSSVVSHIKGLFMPYNEQIYYNPLAIPFELHDHYNKFRLIEQITKDLTLNDSDSDIKHINNFKLDILRNNLDNDQFYFSDFPSWLRMLYTVKAMHTNMEIIDVDYTRIDNLSLLGRNYDFNNNYMIWESILENDQRSNNSTFKGLCDSVGNPKLNYGIELAVDVINEMGRPSIDYNANKIVINKYIKEEDVLLNNFENQIIISDPGTGKTSYYLNDFDDKVIVMVPYKVAVDGIIGSLSKNDQEQIFKIYSGIQIPQNINKYNRIICTYDAIKKLLKAEHVNLSDYTLVIDEAHNFITSSSVDYRFTTMNLLYDALHDFKSVKLLSGTWINAPLDQFDGFKTLEFKLESPKQYNIEIINTPKPLKSLLKNIKGLKSKKKALVFNNNKKTNADIEEYLRTHEIKSVVINANTKFQDNVTEIITSNDYKNNQVVIGTQSICEAISFNNEDIESIHLYEIIAPEMLFQLINRPRRSTPIIYLYVKKNEYSLNAVDVDYQQQFNFLHKLYSKTFNWNLRHDVDRTNYPGMINFQDENKQPTPWIKTDNTKARINQLILANLTYESINQRYNADIFNWLLRLRTYGIMPELNYDCVEDNFTTKQDIINYQMDKILNHWEDVKDSLEDRVINRDYLFPMDKIQPIYNHINDDSILDDPMVREKIVINHKLFLKVMAHIAWANRQNIVFYSNDFSVLTHIDKTTCRFTEHTVNEIINYLIVLKDKQIEAKSIKVSASDIIKATGGKYKNVPMAKRILKNFVTFQPNGKDKNDRFYDVHFNCEKDIMDLLNYS